MIIQRFKGLPNILIDKDLSKIFPKILTKIFAKIL